MEIRQENAKTVRISIFQPWRSNPKHFEQYLEIDIDGNITLGFCDPYECVWSNLRKLTDLEKIKKIYDFIYDGLNPVVEDVT